MKKTCCCCGTAILTIILLLVLAIVGGSWYVFDRYAKPIVGLNLWDTLGLYSELNKVNEKNIVTNPYDAEADLASFENKFKEALFISEDSEFSIQDIIKEAFKDKEEATPSVDSNSSATKEMKSAISDNPFLSFLQKINFDFSSLRNYNGSEAQGVLRASDKEVAALINLAFKEVLSDYAKGAIEGADQYISVKQVIVKAETLDKLDDRVSITVGIDLRKLVISILDNGGSIPSALVSVVNALQGLIPKGLYFTVNIAPYNTEVLPTVIVNDFNDTYQNRTLTMVNSILNYVKKTTDVDQIGALFGEIDIKVKSLFKTMDKYVALDFVEDSAAMDTIQVMLTTLKLDMVTKVDFLYMISYINCRDLSAMDAINYDKEASGEFINRFKNNYAVSDDLDINVDNFLESMSKVADNIDIGKINLDQPNGDINTMLSYDALIDIISASLKEDNGGEVAPVAEGDSTKNDIIKKIEIKQMVITDLTTEQLLILIKLPIKDLVSSMLGDNPDPIIKHLVGQLLPNYLYLQVSVQLIENGSVTISVNGLEILESISLFDTIKSVMTAFVGEDKAKDFSYDAMSKLIGDEVKKAIDTVEKNPKAPLELIFTENGIDLPTVYEMMQLFLNIKGEVDGKEIAPDDVRLTIKGMQELETAAGSIVNGSNENDKLQPFALKNPKIEKIGAGADIKWIAKGDPTINIGDKEMNEIAKKSANTSTADYSVELLQSIFADLSPTANVPSMLMSESFANGFFRDKIAGYVGKTMILTVKIDLKKEIQTNGSESVIPDYMYATAVVDIGDLENGKKSFVFNDMGSVNTRVIELMLSAIMKKDMNLNNILQETIDKFSNSKMDIKYDIPKFTIPNPIPGGDPIEVQGINFENEMLNISDIIANGNIINNNSDMAKALGVFNIDKTLELDVTDKVNQILEELFPPIPILNNLYFAMPGGVTYYN